MTTTPRILVIDDDPDMRRLLRFMLEAARFDVDEAVNGLRLVSKMQVRRPDVIVMDVMMSWGSGMDLCRALKRNVHFQAIPICLISGHRTSLLDVEQARCSGAAAYFCKPLHWPGLLNTLDRLVGRVSSASAAPADHQ